jgi:putative transposase
VSFNKQNIYLKMPNLEYLDIKFDIEKYEFQYDQEEDEDESISKYDILYNVKKAYRNIRREIYNASWYDFRHKMELKCNELGIEFILADKFFPSTQLCHNCGNIKKGKNKLTLKDTQYICDKCGYVNDRDINAALNLQWYIV